jgi:hypothetical protein
LGTFWLKIEQFWPFEEIFIFSNGGYLGYRTALTDTILKGSFRPKDHSDKVWLKLAKWFLTRRFLNDFFAYLCLICIIGQNRQMFKVHKKSPNIC